MSYWDVFIRDCVNYVAPKATVGKKYKLRKTMAYAITNEKPERPEEVQSIKSVYHGLDLEN